MTKEIVLDRQKKAVKASLIIAEAALCPLAFRFPVCAEIFRLTTNPTTFEAVAEAVTQLKNPLKKRGK